MFIKNKKSVEITYLVKVVMNKDGNIKPVNFSHCPKYKETKEKSYCQNDDKSCIGVRDNNILKELDKHRLIYQLQCSYLIKD